MSLEGEATSLDDENPVDHTAEDADDDRAKRHPQSRTEESSGDDYRNAVRNLASAN